MFSIAVENVLHAFVLYTVFGSVIAFLLVLACLKIFKFNEPQMKIQMFMLPLVIPIISFALYHTILDKRCSIGLLYQHSSFLANIDQWLHFISNWMIIILTPLYIIAFFMATFKGLVSLIACRRMIKKYRFASQEQYPELFTIFAKLVKKAAIAQPEILVTPQKYARSFTFGFRNPVIVISKGILEYLDAEELETLLAHEIGHIIRKDSITNWLTVLFRDLLFFTPVTYWAFKYLTNEKEKAADDITIRLTEKPMAFAQALIKVWKLTPKHLISDIVIDNFMPNPGFLKNKGSIEERVERVIGDDFNCHEFNGKKVLILATLITLTVTFFLSFIC